MTSNATLVSTCAVIDAAAKTEDTCDEMKSLQKLVALASNETALADKTKNNATKSMQLRTITQYAWDLDEKPD